MTESRRHFSLLRVLAAELGQNPLNITLYLLVMLSAGGVILSTHHNRQLTIDHEHLMQQRDQLDVEWRHLVLEQSALTEHNRIETLVDERLNMHRPSAEEEVVVRLK